MINRVLFAGIAILITFTTGCTTTKSTKADPLPATQGASVNLRRYDRAVIQPFAFPSRTAEDENAGQIFADNLERRLKNDFGQLFDHVRQGQPTGSTNELIVTGRISQFKPGSRAARLFIPWGPRAELQGDLILKDAATGNEVLTAPFDKLWGWAGATGALKGMDDMIEETAAAAANTIARARGWEPMQSTAKNK
jgi:hypothetical protein